MKEGEVAVEDVVEVDLRVVPGVVEVQQCVALVARRDDVVRHGEAGRVDAVLEAAAEQVDAHDAEDEPEDKADEQHVEDGWDGLDQRVHYHLHANHVQLTPPVAPAACLHPKFFTSAKEVVFVVACLSVCLFVC